MALPVARDREPCLRLGAGDLAARLLFPSLILARLGLGERPPRLGESEIQLGDRRFLLADELSSR